MKKIKFAICFFLLLFCLALNGELYQEYLDAFTGGIYCFHAGKMFGEEKSDIEEKRKIVTELSRQNNCKVFCVDKKLNEATSSIIVIYTPDEITERSVQKELMIAPGEYNSLFSGNTKIEFKPLNEAPDSMTFYFFGEEESIRNIKSNIGFNAGRLKIEKEKNVLWISIVSWLIFGLVLALLTGFDVRFQKKERLVLLSLGKSTISIIFKNIFTDILVLTLFVIVLGLTLNGFTYLSFGENIVLLLFIIVILLNSSVYFFMLKKDLKAAFGKALHTDSLLLDSYFLKAISLVITVIVLSSNILVIAENGSLLSRKDTVEAFGDYYFINVYSENYYEINKKTEKLIADVKQDIVFRESLGNDMAVSVVGLKGDEKDYLLVNKNAASVLEDVKELENIDFTKDYYILVPEDYEDISEGIEAVSRDFISSTEDMKYEIITYSGNKSALYFKENIRYDAVINFALSQSPVIILLNSENKGFSDMVNIDVLFSNMMFDFSEEDKAYYEEKYKLEENMVKIKMNNVKEKTQYAWSVLGRIVGLNTALSLFMLFLELIMIITVSKLEHITNSMEISIKKTLGYSFIRRNRVILILNAISVFIGILVAVIVALLLKSSIIPMIFALGIILLFSEYIVVFYYVTRLEMTSIPKILKGGCL